MFINVRHKSSNELDFSQQHQIFKGTSPIMQNISKNKKPHYTQKYDYNSLKKPSFAQQLRKTLHPLKSFNVKIYHTIII